MHLFPFVLSHYFHGTWPLLPPYTQDKVFKFAMQSLGILSAELRPRSLESFREGPATTKEMMQMLFDHYESRRVENLALVSPRHSRTTVQMRLCLGHCVDWSTDSH